MSKIDIDPLTGSYFFSTIPPLSNYISPCPNCTTTPLSSSSPSCLSCQGTGKSLFPLNSADICFNGNGPNGRMPIGIEVKKDSDLISSLSTKRLQGTQLPKMLNDYQLRYLLWYGRIREGKNGNIEIWIEKISETGKPYGYWFDSRSHYSYSALQKFLCSPSFTNYFIEKHVETKEDAAKWIVQLYEEWNKPWNSHKSMKVFDETKKFNHDNSDIQLDQELTLSQNSHITQGRYGNHTSLGLTLSIIPNKQMVDIFGSMRGIGYDKARVLANNYPTLTSITSIEELANIEVPSQGGTRMIKIGTKLASRIFNIIYGTKSNGESKKEARVDSQVASRADPTSNSSKNHASLTQNPPNSPQIPQAKAKKKTLTKFNLTS